LALGAILLVGAESAKVVSGIDSRSNQLQATERNSTASLAGLPLECVEILGRTMVDRWIEWLLESSASLVTVLVDSSISFPASRYAIHASVKFRRVADRWFAATQTLREYSENGIENAFVATANTYAEFDIADLIEFHRDARRTVTGACDSTGALRMWIADCTKAQREPLGLALSPERDSDVASYFVWKYTNRLEHPEDLRGLVRDVFRGACALRPDGREIRPGVFVGEGAQIHKRARIVAPAFVGRNSKIREDALVTRGSNIESGCCIDCGTAVEDSSILSNTYVGLCLDVAHSIVRGNMLLNVDRKVELQIFDESVVRDNIAIAKQSAYEPLVALSQGG
jgi:NDP-sugar pyrophosphorylase family protein